MKNMQKIYAECIDDLKVYGISLPQYTPKLIVNTRAKKRWGQARGGVNPQININSRLLADDVDDFGARNCMMHEILHLCAPRDNHGGEWKALANKVNRKSEGKYKIKRTSTAEEYGVPEQSSKYLVECSKCGYQIGRERMSKLIEHPWRFTHTGCGGDFRRVR